MQGDQGASGIIRIGNTSRQICPSPAARLRLSVGMAARILPAAQPSRQSLPLFFRQTRQAASSQGVDGKRCDPSAQVGINRPTAVFADGFGNKVRRFQSDWMRGQSARSHAHGHKTGQWRRLQKPAVGWLNRLQDRKALDPKRRADSPQNRAFWRKMRVPSHPHRNQGRQGVTYHRKPQVRIPLGRKRRQLKGQGTHPPPSRLAAAQTAGNGRHR